MTLFWALLIAGAAAVVVGWIGYGIWEWRERKLEKEQPKQRSEKYQQATSAVSDYAKKLAEFKKPTYKRDDSSAPPTT
jgi:predicted negative regulator of RcsB-dependent stress response